MKALLDIVKQHKASGRTGIFSVCSSHPMVIEAAMRDAKQNNRMVLLEATSNQVNQDGGYTGMQPRDFRRLAHKIADKVGLAHDNIVLGGDHLGPNCWQSLTAEEAMDKSDVLISEYVQAGFKKIHLDCSMSCADDSVPLDERTVAERAARLCAISEATWRQHGGEPPVYIIGTEVPVPGGAHEELEELTPTSLDAAKTTISIHQQTFTEFGLTDAWDRVIGLVVQPGVEFDNHKVVHFKPAKASLLSEFSETLPTMVYEAHSTDYQTTENLAALVQGHFCILKVGPGLTYAFREAIWALAAIENEWIAAKEQRSDIRNVVLDSMKKNPKYWQKYYATEAHQQRLDCQYSLSDRVRYYWPTPNIEYALEKLIENMNQTPPPLTLISQYMPNQYRAAMAGKINVNAHELIFHKISEVLEQYATACYPDQNCPNQKIL